MRFFKRDTLFSSNYLDFQNERFKRNWKKFAVVGIVLVGICILASVLAVYVKSSSDSSESMNQVNDLSQVPLVQFDMNSLPFELKVDANYSFPKSYSSHSLVLVRDGVSIAKSVNGSDWRFLIQEGNDDGFLCEPRKCWIHLKPLSGNYMVQFYTTLNDDISEDPSEMPTLSPSLLPTSHNPTRFPTKAPTSNPTKSPTRTPSNQNQTPTKEPTKMPTNPNQTPTKEPTQAPTKSPTKQPTSNPTEFPTKQPTSSSPTQSPTLAPPTNPIIGPPLPTTAPKVILPKLGIDASELAVIVNELDAQSVEVAQYYQMKRSIPNENMIRIQLPTSTTDDIGAVAFNITRSQILAATRPNIKAYAITWLKPWRVAGRMSITSAIAFGFNESWGGWTGSCSSKKESPFYSADPPIDFWRDREYDITYNSFYLVNKGKMLDYFGVGNSRPTIAITGVNKQEAFNLIDRGVASDGTMPNGTAYLMQTTDSKRSVRSNMFAYIDRRWNDSDVGFNFTYIPLSESKDGVLRNRNDTFLYLTGFSSVPDIKKNRYLPGAVADHLTSYGGQLTSGGQMSILRWLEAGATGSSGAVVEPCNFPDKFLEAQRLLVYYMMGRSLIESMWAAVNMPGEVIFVGEPLASPFKGAKTNFDPVSRRLEISVYFLFPKQKYTVEASVLETGPFVPVLQNIMTDDYRLVRIVINNADKPFYRIRKQ